MSEINRLSAVLRVIDRHALRYTGGADPATDRPAHVRAGSACCDGAPTMCALLDEHGEPLRDKVEGIALDPDDVDVAWIVVDKDDPNAPAELLRVDLAGVLR